MKRIALHASSTAAMANGSSPLHAMRGWSPLLILPASTFVLVPATWPRWALMWSLAVAIYAGCKWLTWRRTDVSGVPLWKQVAYLFAWPGLDARAFLKANCSHADRPLMSEWLFAAAKFAVGLLLIGVVAGRLPAERPYIVGWVGMLGIVFTLHFGLFHLLSCVWRTLGVDAKPLMNWPLLSESVSEFWGARWNRAFRDLTHRFLFRPLTSRFGPRIALALGFVFSGLVHDFVITVPAGGGYGGPTLFFLIQALGVLVERSKIGRRLGLGNGYRGWLFAVCVTLGPVYWLFPPAFVTGIIVPFLAFLGAA